jgi:hypothetical protein
LAQFLHRFWTSFLIILLKFDSVPAEISTDERITRFVFSKHYIKNGKIAPQAFLPHKVTRETSVYRTNGCSEKRVWLLGDLFVTRLRKDAPALIGRGDVLSQAVFAEGLKIVAFRSPHPRHAVLRNWPNEKAHQRIKAIALAQKASLRLH